MQYNKKSSKTQLKQILSTSKRQPLPGADCESVNELARCFERHSGVARCLYGLPAAPSASQINTHYPHTDSHSDLEVKTGIRIRQADKRYCMLFNNKPAALRLRNLAHVTID